jgi:hypothetical protein
MTDNLVSVAADKPLFLGKNATLPLHATTLAQLDAGATELRGAINTIAGTDTALDTLAEMKLFVDGVSSSGASNLLGAVTAESDARKAAVTAASASAASALASVDSSIRTLVSNEVATRTAEDTFLRNKLFQHIPVQVGPALYADGAQPSPMPTTVRASTLLDGVYYKNAGPAAALKKINFYFGAPVDSTGKATAASLLEMDIPLRLVNNVSNAFITVYTKPTGTGDDKSWYHGRYTYNVTQSLTANTNYLFRALISGASVVGSLSGFTNVNLSIEGFTSSTHPLLPTDEILFISIGTDSSSAAGNVECVIHGLYLHSTNGNVAYQLSNRDVLSKYMADKVNQLFLSMGQEAPMTLFM